MSSTILLILGSDEVAGGGGGADVEAVGAAVASERANTDDEPSGLYIHWIFVESARQSLRTDGDGESVSEGYSSHRTNAAHPLRGRDREQRAIARSEDEQRVYETTMISEEKMRRKYRAYSLPLLC